MYRRVRLGRLLGNPHPSTWSDLAQTTRDTAELNDIERLVGPGVNESILAF